MTTVVTRGAASAQALGYASGPTGPVNYIEDVFSTYLYTPPTSFVTNTINNGIDLSGKGGMVWFKARNASTNHQVYDTVRGSSDGNARALHTNTSGVQETTSFDYITPSPSGFSANFASGGGQLTYDGYNFVSWTFREQPKFFDVVTYGGNGDGQEVVPHNLGSVPGFIIVKATSTTGDWSCYHRDLGINSFINLNSTAASQAVNLFDQPTSTHFTVKQNLQLEGVFYVAYLFAHDAGGFGLTGTDNVISCGSFTTDGSGAATVNLGYEPQWILTRSTGADNWRIYDNMRGFDLTDGLQLLPNSSAAEASSFKYTPSATGFSTVAANVVPSQAYIYIAIRRGPMKVPTSGTSVFSPIYSAAAANTVLTTSFPVDLQIPAYTGATVGRFVVDRLRGVVTTAVDAATSPWMKTNATDAETTGFNITRAWDNTGYQIPQYLGGGTTVYFNFRRAPGFFDEVCYTGTGAAATVTHNLAAVPELIIVKSRSNVVAWPVWSKSGTQRNDYLINLNGAGTYGTAGDLVWGSPGAGVPNMTSTVFSVGDAVTVNNSGWTYVAYLFATVAGVSKVGSYTGNGTTQTIDCGFGAGGVRFVLIKRIDAGGGWYVYDTARGMTVLTDPYLLLNTTAAEVATLGSVTTVSTGFALNSTILADINVNAGTYIFLAIA